MNSSAPVGALIREWRQRRRLSQLDLAGDAEISTRHLSFVETGRSLPSREMVLKLAERLDVPLRERNRLLTAAGYAPMFRERSLDDPELQAAREAVSTLLAAHEPFPALAIDRHWQLIAANRPVTVLMQGIEDVSLLEPPVNVLRLSLHPNGLAPRIVNLAQWRGHLLARLHHQIGVSADPVLARLFDELRQYPAPRNGTQALRQRRHRAAAACQPRGDAEPAEHDHGLRHAGRCDLGRDRARIVLPGRRLYRPSVARAARGLTVSRHCAAIRRRLRLMLRGL